MTSIEQYKPGHIYYQVEKRADHFYEIIEIEFHPTVLRRVAATAIQSIHFANGAAEKFAEMSIAPKGVAIPLDV